MSETLPLTGERTVPGIWHENYWYARHEAAYRWLLARPALAEGSSSDPELALASSPELALASSPASGSELALVSDPASGSEHDHAGDRPSGRERGSAGGRASGSERESVSDRMRRAGRDAVRGLVGGRVLDAGCGEGYGAALLAASGAEQVVGLDYDPTAIQHASRRYDELVCVQGNLVRTGFADGSFDLVVSLQTVEHLWDQRQFVVECRRILSSAGTLVLSTPNRLTFPSGNCYHTHELTAKELVALVEPELDVVELLGLWHGPRLAEWEAMHGSCVTAQLTGTPDTWSPELAELVRSIDHRDFTLTAHHADPDSAHHADLDSDLHADLDSALDLIVIAQPPTPPLDRPRADRFDSDP